MKRVKKELKLLYTFIIIFIVCAFLLLLNIILILSTTNEKETIKEFEKASNSVVSIQTYINCALNKKGSGFIYKADKDYAYILTNNHVIEDTTSYKVFISETESVNAKLLGYDKYLDAAVLSIENDDYKALKLNNKNNLNIGDSVYTIGTPLDNEFYNSVASGIISKTSRFRIEENSNEDILMNMIQTDIITNQGNSGGPLFNKNLEVIGMMTSNIKSTNPTGISYAVPITEIIPKLDEIEKGQVVERKINNVEIVDIKDSEKLYVNDLIEKTQEDQGVVVLNDDKDSSLKKGDVIVEIDNKEIKDINYYNYYLNQYKLNSKVKLKVKRNNKYKTITVELNKNTN